MEYPKTSFVAYCPAACMECRAVQCCCPGKATINKLYAVAGRDLSRFSGASLCSRCNETHPAYPVARVCKKKKSECRRVGTCFCVKNIEGPVYEVEDDGPASPSYTPSSPVYSQLE